jgi:hypothetical protein
MYACSGVNLEVVKYLHAAGGEKLLMAMGHVSACLYSVHILGRGSAFDSHDPHAHVHMKNKDVQSYIYIWIYLRTQVHEYIKACINVCIHVYS